jgi:hypothetical protein
MCSLFACRLPEAEHHLLRPGQVRRGDGVADARAGRERKRGGGDAVPGGPVLPQRQPGRGQEVLRQDLQRGEPDCLLRLRSFSVVYAM